MSLHLNLKKERITLSKEETYDALNAYLENVAFVRSEFERSKLETWEQNLKESAYIEEVFKRVKKEKTADFNKRNTLPARLDEKLNYLERNEQKSENNQKKSSKQKIKELFNNSNSAVYLGIGIVGAAITAGGACGVSFLSAAHGVDPKFCASVLAGGVVLGGKILAAGGVAAAARMTLSKAFSNKGGKELLQAKENLKNLHLLKARFIYLNKKDSLFSKNEAKKNTSLQASIRKKEPKENLSAIVMNKMSSAQKGF